MTDYQRILSYLYRYEKTEKRECLGFVKAEQKTGGLRLTIQIDDERLVQGMKLKLCFYEKKEEGWQVWQMDSFGTQEHKEELHLTYSVDKLPEGFQIKGQSGIFLYYQDGFYYGSVWIGEEIPKEVLEPRRWHKVNSDRQLIAEPESKLKQREEPEPELKSEQKEEVETESKSEEREKAESELQSGLKEETSGLKQDLNKKRVPEIPEENLQNRSKDIGTLEEPVRKDESENIEVMNSAEDIEDVSQDIDVLEETENTKAMDIVDDMQESEDPVDNFEKMWINSVKEKYPVDNIFNTAFYEGYKVSVAELKQFGKEAESLGSNQFLLKGYERYRHLLAGRVRYAGEKRYCIGVPGIYENREKYMAEIYQFPIFLSLTENRMKTGNFGYWLHLMSGNM